MNIFETLFTFLESIYNSVQNIYNFLTTEIGIGDYTFTPLTGIFAIVGLLLGAWLIKKLVPIA